MQDFQKTAFIGAGRMATAFVRGLLAGGVRAERISACDVSSAAAAEFTEKTGVACFVSPEEALKNADTVVIAVKPQNIDEALRGATGLLSDKLLISIVAGTRISRIMELTSSERVVRVMPNTPALVGKGISAYSLSMRAGPEDSVKAEKILSSVGALCRVDEDQLDAVTGLSGSGPAYVFEFISALQDGGVRAGLPEETAFMLALQTVAGAVELLEKTGETPEKLRDQVSSPGGTTEAGLAHMAQNKFRRIVSDTVKTAADRSVELGRSG